MSLDHLPKRYRFYDREPWEPWKTRGLRIVSIDNYCVFYFVDDDNLTFSIIRVMYSGRDIIA